MKRRTIANMVWSALVLLLLMVSAACVPLTPPSSEADGTAVATEEPSVEATEEASEEADASQELVGTTWQWVGTVYGDDTVVTVEEPSRYTLTFNADGTVGVQFDCNSGGGEFTVEGPMLSFGPMRMTLMACPEDSQADIFATDLENVNSFVLQDGHLFLAIKLDTGIMEFAPLEATEEATASPEEEGEANVELSGVLTGTVTYLQRIALPAGSVIEVYLEDVSRQDVAATTVATQTITTAGENVPIPFELTYDPAAIDPAMSYALRVRITVDGQLHWINTTSYPVLTRGAAVTDVEVVVEPV